MRKVILSTIILLQLASGIVRADTPVQPVDPKRESPRATLKTFLEAFHQPRVGVTPDPIDEAIKCLDLDSIPPDYRVARGFELAAQLDEVINAIENLHPDDVPADKKGDPYHVFTSPHGEIVITRHPSGEWLFNQETVRVIPLLIADIEEQRRMHGTSTLTQADSYGGWIRDRVPIVLRPRDLGLERWQWIGLGVLLVLGFIMWKGLRLMSAVIIGPVMRRRSAVFEDQYLTRLYSPVALLVSAVVVRLGLRALALTPTALSFIRNVLFVVTALVAIWLIYRLIDIIILRLHVRARGTESNMDDLLVPFIGAIVRFSVVVIGLIVVAENLSFNVTGLIAGLGIGGIAIALASQETLSNFFGSLVLLIEQPFKAEDRVEADSVKGVVKEVGIRSTRILTDDNNLVTVPNSNIAKTKIVNAGVNRARRWVVRMSVPYQNGAERIEAFHEGIEKIIKKSKDLDNEVYRVHLFDLVPPSLIMRVEINFREDDYSYELAARHRFITECLRLAAKLGIDLQVPN